MEYVQPQKMGRSPWRARTHTDLHKGNSVVSRTSLVLTCFFSDAQKLLLNDRLILFCKTSILTDPMNISGWLLLAKPDCSLSADSGELFEKQGFADVILSASGRELHAHKAVLSARSSVSSVLFRHDMLENKNNRVEADDVRYDVLQEMVHFIYAGRTPNLIEMSYELLQAAEKYYLERLKVMCKDVLCLNLTTENVAGTLILAGLHSAK
jgi:speckle-type POZ protein